MPADFSLAIVAPDRAVLDQQTSHVLLPGAAGYFGVYSGHEPFVFALQKGQIEYYEGAIRKSITISGGFAEVTPERVTVLADSVIV